MSASPRTTAIALAPADPISISCPWSSSARYVAAAGGRERLTMMRGAAGDAGGGGGGCRVESVRPMAGSATAPATGRPSIVSALFREHGVAGGDRRGEGPHQQLVGLPVTFVLEGVAVDPLAEELHPQV